jgi:hypothetical protein
MIQFLMLPKLAWLASLIASMLTTPASRVLVVSSLARGRPP